MAVATLKFIKLFKILCEKIQHLIKSSYQSNDLGELKVHLKFGFRLQSVILNLNYVS